MRTQVQWIPGTDDYGVWILLDGMGDRPSVGKIGDKGRIEWVTYDEGADIPPTFVLPSRVLGELRRALSGDAFSRAGEPDHLNDAIKVRDELLAMVKVAFLPTVQAPR